MKKINIYDEKLKIDKVWFDSSNILYAECKDNDNDFKTVKIIFKNGTQYVYYDVNVNDWIKFREATSQGKALNIYITQKNKETKKPIYEFRRLEDVDVNLIQKQLENKDKQNNYSINKNDFYKTMFDAINNNIEHDDDNKNIINITNNIMDILENIAKEHNNILQIDFN